MDMQVSSTHLRQNLSSILDKIEEGNLVCAIERKGHEKMVMLPESEYSSIMETLHLTSGPKNHQALLDSYKQAEEGDVVTFESVEDLDKYISNMSEE